MQKPLRVGIVGAGFFSQFHLDGWRRIPGVEVSVLCDTDLDRARTVGDRYGVKHTTGDLEQVLSQSIPEYAAAPTSRARRSRRSGCGPSAKAASCR